MNDSEFKNSKVSYLKMLEYVNVYSGANNCCLSVTREKEADDCKRWIALPVIPILHMERLSLILNLDLDLPSGAPSVASTRSPRDFAT